MKFGFYTAIARRIFLPCILCIPWSLLVLGQAEALPDFEREVKPVLAKRCYGCHGAEKQKGKLRLDTMSTDLLKDPRSAERWHEVRALINLGEMPPEDEPKLTAEERRVILDWLNPTIERAVKSRQSKGGRVVVRRLNRSEYQNTLSDLLGVRLDYTRDFPPDGVSPDGMLNNGSSLQMSDIQLEFYIAAARAALDRIITTDEEPKVFRHRFTKSTDGGFPDGVQGANDLGRHRQFIVRMKNDYPEQGAFRIRTAVRVELPEKKGPVPRLRVRVGYRPDTLVDMETLAELDLHEAGEHELEFVGRIENFPLPVRGQGKYPGLVVMLSNAHDEFSQTGKTQQREITGADGKKKKIWGHGEGYPRLHVEWLEFEGPYFDQWPPEEHRQILFPSHLREVREKAYVRKVLKSFLSRAWRRPVNRKEVRRYAGFYRKLRSEFPDLESALRETLVMALVAPDFLYLLEPAAGESRPLTAHELASRLSFFLWNTMPDDELRRLADSGALLDEATLSAQVSRMVADERSNRFIDTFVEQWLDIDAMNRVEVDTKVYPAFGRSKRIDHLRELIRREPVEFFGEILRQNLSAENFIRSDFVMLNDALARHYRFDGVHGGAFRPVSTKRQPPEAKAKRGGLLTQSAILLGASTGGDSHIIKRAVFVRERLLDDPPDPPPPNVPELETAEPGLAKLSIREQLKHHNNDPACADCHRGIDGWGLAMEEYDALGQWRTEITRKLPDGKLIKLPLETLAKLPDGREVDGMEALKEYLLTERREQFARAFVVKLLTYALGRSLEFSDEKHIDELTRRFADDSLRVQSLVRSIVTSEVFRTK